MAKDQETSAMRTIVLVLAALHDEERDRVVRWLYDRFVLARTVAQEEAPARSER